MGYESRVYVASKYNNNAFKKARVYVASKYNDNAFKKDGMVDVLAEFNLSVMTNGFKDLFTKEIESPVYLNQDMDKIEVDKYEERLKYTDNIKSVLTYLENNFTYRRSRMLYNFLISAERDFSDLIIIHCGY